MAKKLSEHELRQQAIQALTDRLGPVEALRFLALKQMGLFQRSGRSLILSGPQ
jgi:hypothetical protein